MRKIKHHQYDVKASIDLSKFPEVKGYGFEKGFSFNEFLKAYSSTGFQATSLSQAISIVGMMQREKATIFLGCTSNLISSGLRDIIKFLVKHRHIQVLVTTAGGIEEDIIKCMQPFHIGSFEIPGRYLYDHGVARIGNILVPNDRYAYFEEFMDSVLKKFYEEQKKGSIGSTADLIRLMGKEINNEDSILYWAQKNNIPVFCPGITDGATGDQVYFAKQRWKDFYLDIAKDIKQIVDIALNAEKTGVILLGGGISKHFVLNANIFRDGCDYAVYVNTGQEFDGSDSGARIDEAITWAKVKPNAPNVKVYADATIVFPIIVAATFAKSKKK